jgi:hypothetical protein
MMDEDDGTAISYYALERGTPIVSADGQPLGTVERVVDNPKEHIFDGIVMRAPDGQKWVDAPEVARIAERRVTLTLDAETAADILAPYRSGAPEFRANPRGGRLSRLFGGGGWRRS